MKRLHFLLIVALLVSVHSVPAQVPKGSLNFMNAQPVQVLIVYSHMSGLALIEDSRVRQIHRPIQIRADEVSNSEALKLMEDALLKQAGIVITPLGDKRVSVTYNDALPIAGGKH
ncbi:MAG TPA: hypothetical protein VMF08_08065 [Candidatus Sulfotelmatobacter sp.]|nr:hypothetical protein [Candidatus Sulfotelmatobacter sp.]